MAVYEVDGLLRYLDREKNLNIVYAATKTELIVDLDEWLGKTFPGELGKNLPTEIGKDSYLVNSKQNGTAPKIINKASATTVGSDYLILASADGDKVTWYKLPAEAFKDTVYSLPTAANGTKGGIQIGYSENGQKYAVKLDGEKAYVEVPWKNTEYSDATSSQHGLMSVQDKKNLDILMSLLGSDTEPDSDKVVNKIREVLEVFENYPEGDRIISILDSKADKTEIIVTRVRGTASGTYTSGDITIAAGTNVSISQSGATITINATDTKDWASITGKPTWIGASKPTYGWGEINDKPTWIGASKPGYTWTEITNKPSWIGDSKPGYSWSEINDKPIWIGAAKPTYTWSEIGSKPTWITDTKPTYTWTEITSKPSWIGSTKPGYTWSEITDKPNWIGSTKPTYTASEVGAAAAGDLAKYLLLAGGTLTGNLTLNAPSHTAAAQIRWSKIGTADPFIGYALNQTDGTFLLMSISGGDNYQNGLAIGGSTGNLLWKGTKVATVNDIPTVNNGTLTVQGANGLTGSGTFTANSSTSPTITINHAGKAAGLANLAASGRRYVTGLTFDDYGHVTGYTTGTETVVDTKDWASITGKPSWIGDSKPTYTWTEIGSKPSWIGDSKPSYAWSEITSKPTWIGADKPTYTVSEIAGAAAASDLDNYLPLTGGTLSGSLITRKGLSIRPTVVDTVIIPQDSIIICRKRSIQKGANVFGGDTSILLSAFTSPNFQLLEAPHVLFLRIDIEGNAYLTPDIYPIDYPLYQDGVIGQYEIAYKEDPIILMAVTDIEVSQVVMNYLKENFELVAFEENITNGYVFNARATYGMDCYEDLNVRGTQLNIQSLSGTRKMAIYSEIALYSKYKNAEYEVVFRGTKTTPMVIYSSPLELSCSSGIIDSDGSYGTQGQVLTSQGEGSAPKWTTVSAGSGDTSDFVTLYGTQLIYGSKTFSAYPTISSSNGIYFSSALQSNTDPTHVLTLSSSGYGYTRATSLADLKAAMGINGSGGGSTYTAGTGISISTSNVITVSAATFGSWGGVLLSSSHGNTGYSQYSDSSFATAYKYQRLATSSISLNNFYATGRYLVYLSSASSTETYRYPDDATVDRYSLDVMVYATSAGPSYISSVYQELIRLSDGQKWIRSCNGNPTTASNWTTWKNAVASSSSGSSYTAGTGIYISDGAIGVDAAYPLVRGGVLLSSADTYTGYNQYNDDGYVTAFKYKRLGDTAASTTCRLNRFTGTGRYLTYLSSDANSTTNYDYPIGAPAGRYSLDVMTYESSSLKIAAVYQELVCLTTGRKWRRSCNGTATTDSNWSSWKNVITSIGKPYLVGSTTKSTYRLTRKSSNSNIYTLALDVTTTAGIGSIDNIMSYLYFGGSLTFIQGEFSSSTPFGDNAIVLSGGAPLDMSCHIFMCNFTYTPNISTINSSTTTAAPVSGVAIIADNSTSLASYYSDYKNKITLIFPSNYGSLSTGASTWRACYSSMYVTSSYE